MLNEQLPTNKQISTSFYLSIVSIAMVFVLGVLVLSNTIQINDLVDSIGSSPDYGNINYSGNQDPIYPNGSNGNFGSTGIIEGPPDDTPDSTPYMATEFVEYTGVIKKEKIPEEYALGDYWYNFYFDKPQMIETAAGLMKQKYVQIEASTIDSLDPYLDQNVTVLGRLSYGYAESRIILADEIVVNE